ncbi:MAG: hypothetical protein LPJ89_09320 [Hymenobacteraceae bacterium]|nr:hypothetical protein [Hymenobacteraceae bacterium]MDX5397941.1 hypothetical protein [Hymenobacteraceae bacterium]MDX5443965.1 hypothetical protein [Hymenobacteraceae bacterium]MDX5514012.1 hypothetical protein [Hymenobacteraceae bacterium]
MPKVSSIAKQFRLIFTSLTLLCALALNNRELTTYTLPVSLPVQEQAVQPKEQKQTEVKQKVTFEATSSYVVLHLEKFVSCLRVVFTKPLELLQPLFSSADGITGFFRILSATQIMPNAP